MNWKDVTLEQFLELQKLDEKDPEAVFKMAEILLGEEIDNLSLYDFAEKMKELNFRNEEIPKNQLVKKLELGGRKYVIDGLLGDMTAAQFIDFTTYQKSKDIVKQLSVFIIPKGHKYNDGYDMEVVFKDIPKIPITVANSLAFFLLKQWVKFIELFQSSLLSKMKKLKMNPKEMKTLENFIKIVDLSGELCLTY